MDEKVYTVTIPEASATRISGMLDKFRCLVQGYYAVSLFQPADGIKGENWLWDQQDRTPYMSVADLVKLIDEARVIMYDELCAVDVQREADETIARIEREQASRRKAEYVRPVMRVARAFADNLNECE